MNSLLAIGGLTVAGYLLLRGKTWRDKGWTEVPAPQDQVRPPGIPPRMLPTEERVPGLISGQELVKFIDEVGGRTINTGAEIATGESMARLGQVVMADVAGLSGPSTVIMLGSGALSRIIFFRWGSGFPFGPRVWLTEGTLLRTEKGVVLKITRDFYETISQPGDVSTSYATSIGRTEEEALTSFMKQFGFTPARFTLIGPYVGGLPGYNMYQAQWESV